MKTLRREKHIVSMQELLVLISPCVTFLYLLFLDVQNQLIYVRQVSYSSLPNCLAYFQDLAGFYGNKICSAIEELDESVIKANNNKYIYEQVLCTKLILNMSLNPRNYEAFQETKASD